MKKVSSKTFFEHKQNNEKITMLTAYDYSTARYIDEAGVDSILVGDSLGMVILGYENTLQVTIEDMVLFTGAVARGAKRAMVIADMPFGAYHSSLETGIENACKLLRAGANAVKVEGGSDFTVSLVKRLTETGIPVVAHLGFTPQYLNGFGGFAIQGKTFESTNLILEQAKKLEQAGAFSLVLEMVPEECATYITEHLTIPTIGIGAGRHCSGQVLVSDDIFGKYGDFAPKFARKYGDMKSFIIDASSRFIQDVKNGKFPSDDEIFTMNKDESVKIYANH